MKRFKSLVVLGIVGMLGLSGCSGVVNATGGSNTASLDSKMVQTVKDAAKKLNDTYADYIVSNGMSSAGEDATYIEVWHSGADYTEYPVDDDGNIGTIEYGSQDSISYIMTDYYKDNKYYISDTDSENTDEVLVLPETFNKYVSDRCMLYANNLMDKAKSIKQIDDDTLTLGDEEFEMKCYKAVVDSSAIKDVLGLGTYAIYSSVMEDSGTDSNIGKLCSFYLQDLNMNLTFSDANVTFGIDPNGILRFVGIEVGGLGSRLYMTKVVVATSNPNIRDNPDLSGAKAYSSILSEPAELIVDCDTYEEAAEKLGEYIDSLNESSDTSDTDSESDDADESDNADEAIVSDILDKDKDKNSD